MRWTSSGRSRNIEDRRGQRTTYRRPTSIGCGGLIFVLVISYVLGWNPLEVLMLTGGSQPVQPQVSTSTQDGPYRSSPQEEQLVDFVSFVLDDVQTVWSENLPRWGVPYRDAKLVLFRDAVQSACGFAVEEGLNAAAAIGDDRIQKMSGQYVNPDAFTHGSSEQRVGWFSRGLESGDLDSCDTFGAAGL